MSGEQGRTDEKRERTPESESYYGASVAVKRSNCGGGMGREGMKVE